MYWKLAFEITLSFIMELVNLNLPVLYITPPLDSCAEYEFLNKVLSMIRLALFAMTPPYEKSSLVDFKNSELLISKSPSLYMLPPYENRPDVE